MNELPKLPQARMYLQSAQWGFDELLTKQLNGYAYRFYLIGILASLRAVQHALKNHDSTLSEEHRRVIEDWWQATPLSTPELHFIQTTRNLILKRGSFKKLCHPFGIFDRRGTERRDNRCQLRVGDAIPTHKSGKAQDFVICVGSRRS